MPDTQTTEYRATQLVYSKSLSWVTQFDSITNLTGFLNIPRLRNVDNTHQKMNHQSKNATTLRCCCIHATLLGCPFVHPETTPHGPTWRPIENHLVRWYLCPGDNYSIDFLYIFDTLTCCGCDVRGSWIMESKDLKKNIYINWYTFSSIINYHSNWRWTTRCHFAREIWL